MSDTLVRLAADMASFNNLDPSEVLDKLRSGLAGQVRSLRTLGVFLDDARLKEEAYATGLVAVGSDLTAAQKIQVRYNLILKDTARQQGDFARTLGVSLPNQARVLNATMEDLSATIGKDLLPVFLIGTKFAVTLAHAFQDLPEPVQRLTGAALGLVAGLTLIGGVVGLVKLSIGQLIPTTAAGTAAIEGPTVALSGLAAAARTAALSLTGVGLLVGAAFLLKGPPLPTNEALLQAALAKRIELLKGEADAAQFAGQVVAGLAHQEASGTLTYVAANHALDGLNQQLAAAGFEAEGSASLMHTLATNLKQVGGDAAGAAPEVRRLFDEERIGAAMTDKLAVATRHLATAQFEAAAGVRDHLQAELALAGGLLGVEGAERGATDASNRLTEARRAVNKALKDHGKSSQEYRDALAEEKDAEFASLEAQLSLRNAVQSYADQLTGPVDAALAHYNEVAADTESSQEDIADAATAYQIALVKMRGDQQEAIDLVRQMGEKAGLSKGEIQKLIEKIAGYTDKLKGIPDVVTTKVVTEFLTRGIPGQPAPHARGTRDALGGWSIINEEGPELVWLPPHSKVIPAAATQQILQSGAFPGFAEGAGLLDSGSVEAAVERGIRKGLKGLGGMAIVGVLDTPFGPTQMRGVIREEITAHDRFRTRVSRLGGVS
jgi:hypothetical protein